MYTIKDFRLGNRVELHPATDAWVSGDRYGTVVRIGRVKVQVRMDRSKRIRAIGAQDIGAIHGQGA